MEGRNTKFPFRSNWMNALCSAILVALGFSSCVTTHQTNHDAAERQIRLKHMEKVVDEEDEKTAESERLNAMTIRKMHEYRQPVVYGPPPVLSK